MKLRRLIYAVTALILLANGIYSYRAYCSDGAGGAAGSSKQDAKNGSRTSLEEQVEILMQVMELIRRNHVDGEKISEQEMMTNAIRGLAMSMDPFTEYMPPREYKDFSEQSEGVFGGIGVRLDYRDGKTIVLAPIEGTPAAKAGIMAGDQIVEVDGVTVGPNDGGRLSDNLRGDVGTDVTVGIRRGGDDGEIIRYTLKRAEIVSISVADEHLVEGTGIGYLRVLEFTQNTPKEFESALRKLQPQAVEGLVIDLRNNPGGLLESARQMCSFFLPDKQLVVSVEGRGAGGKHENLSNSSYKFPENVPVVILINGGSASAAEIMASCLNDYDRAGLAGERSFGKGSVQNTISFPDGSALKLTIAKYFTKSRREIHGKGIMPEMALKMTRKEYLALYETEDVAKVDRMDKHLQLALDYIRKYKGRPSLYRQANPQQPAEKATEENSDDEEATEEDSDDEEATEEKE